MEWVKRNILRGFGHIGRMGSEEFVKKVYMNESVGPSNRGQPPGRWKDRLKDYIVREVLPEGEGWMEQGGSVWRVRGGGFSTMAIPLGDISGGRKASDL